MTKFFLSEEALIGIQDRIEKIKLWIEESNLDLIEEQRHLDEGSPERAYWHHGYMMALKDVLSSSKQQTELDDIKDFVQNAKNSYFQVFSDSDAEQSATPIGAKDLPEEEGDPESELEGRIVLTHHWDWVPGMRRYVQNSAHGGKSFGRMISNRLLVSEDLSEKPTILEIEGSAKPDLSDPATFGAVLQIIRSVFSDNTISFQHHGHGVEVTSINSFDTQTINGALAKHISRFSYFSEIEAATCLMEFATQLKNNNFID